MAKKRLHTFQASVQRRHQFDEAMAFGQIYAGVDEVGRGCLAGPVVAAAVLPPADIATWEEVDDSKRLSETWRNALADLIHHTSPAVAVGMADVSEIDELNILKATQIAMERAVTALTAKVELVLVDGIYPIHGKVASLPIVGGDHRSLTIAAASIVAKVYRDNYMKTLDKVYPGYGFAQHVGYGTKQHLAALHERGVTEVHRRSFAPVQEATSRQLELVLNG